MTDDRVTVHLLDLPVPLAAGARQWFEELLREFALIHAGAADHARTEVPSRLTEMVDSLVTRYAGINDLAQERLEAAIDRGDAVIADHVLEVPREAAAASAALDAMMDEADEFCRQGKHLLTLTEPHAVQVYRRWYLEQVVSQVSGEAPVPWSEYLASTA